MGKGPKRKIRGHQPTRAPEFEIVRLTGVHLSAVSEIAWKCFPVRWSLKDFTYFLENPQGLCLGVQLKENNGEQLVAYLLTLFVAGDADIVSIATTPEHRRCGFSNALLLALEQTPGVKRMFLEVDAENAAAIGLYVAAGFSQTGIRRKYYEAKRDAILMSKTIVSESTHES